MRYVLAILAVLIPMTVRGEKPPAKAPPVSADSPWTKEVFDAALTLCEARIGEVEPGLPLQNLRAYCRCFVSKSKEAFPKGIPETLDEKTLKRMEIMVDACYEKHVTPWAEKQKKSKRGKGVEL